MKSKKNYLNHIRLYKLVLLIITSAIACTSFLILYLNHDFREFVYSDKKLLILCALLWITLLTEFTHTLLDLLSLKRLAQTDHVGQEAVALKAPHAAACPAKTRLHLIRDKQAARRADPLPQVQESPADRRKPRPTKTPCRQSARRA